ncbi:diaminopimelate epimerase [Gorillibacterium timonense]|uniref:diaminopimelate epimerase n=1 Tax=Gorillibacterium timonense TaxID=1689269 RepID=UPI00071D7CFC|nr:diaminopimelate epimerase [Gorillibacterium timonense]
MEFVKMQGIGNDFIIIYGEKALPADASEFAKRWCDRHFGIGADGVVYLLPSAEADMMMRIINSDGTEPEQCGNAIRCAAKYLFDRAIVPRTLMTIETIGAGVQPVEITVADGMAAAVRVDMGKPILNAAAIPTTLEGESIVDQVLEAGGREFRFTAVSMGNPHCVIFTEQAEQVNLAEWGPILEHHPAFPRKTNVEFVTVRSPEHLIMRVWERGAGSTLACGTGACASLVAAVLNGHSPRKATVSLAGGDLTIEWSEEDGRVYMTGPAEEVFRGTL